MITNETIGQLLEKYWQGQTSVAEEKQLRSFFAGENVPDEWMKYRSLFVWENKQKEIQFVKPYRFTRPISIRRQIYPALKIAASILILLAFGISVFTHYKQEKFIDTIFTEMNTVSVDSMASPLEKEVVAKAKSLEEIKAVEESNNQ